MTDSMRQPLGRRTHSLMALVVLLWPLSAAGQPTDWQIRGQATNPATGAPIYTEYHVIRESEDSQPRERVVHYYRPDGSQLARKVLRFNLGYPYLPELDWSDYETDTTITGRWNSGTYRQVVEGTDPRTEAADLAAPDRVIFDAAFDRYLIDRFSDLEQNGRVEFEFLSLGAGRTFAFRAVIASTEGDEITVRVEPASQIARWFVDPITTVYDTAGPPRLVRFEGITNFRRNGDLIEADIRYDYADR